MLHHGKLSEETVNGSVTIHVRAEHNVSEARRGAKHLAEARGFRHTITYHIVTSVSELANNLFFHTSDGGTITMTPIHRDGACGIEVIAEDKGPGIPDIGLAMQDGFSTNGGLGGGLPGVERLMDEFELKSTVGVGTRIVTRKWQT
jgi:serine/threonine-protein kinase RsbT